MRPRSVRATGLPLRVTARPLRRYAAPLALAALLGGCAGSVPSVTSTDPVALHAAADLARQVAEVAAARAAGEASAASAGTPGRPAGTEAVGPAGGSSTTAGGSRPRGAATAPSVSPPAASSPVTTGVSPSTTVSVSAARSAGPAALRIVDATIPFTRQREEEMSAYSLRHYGSASAQLTPTMIVLHFTAGDTWTSARDTFAADVANLGELPGTCAHYVIDRDGTVYSLVPVTLRCRHTIGLNDQAIGIEMVQPAGPSGSWADQQILARPAQVGAALALVRELQARYAIPASAVIGHAMANDDPHFHDLLGWRNDHVDWQPADVAQFRARL